MALKVRLCSFQRLLNATRFLDFPVSERLYEGGHRVRDERAYLIHQDAETLLSLCGLHTLMLA